MIFTSTLNRRSALAVRLIGLALILWSILSTDDHPPGLHGRGLVVLIATVAATGGWLVWSWIGWHDPMAPRLTPDLFVVAAAGGLLTLTNGGAGTVFAFAAIFSAGLRVAPTRAFAVTAVGTATAALAALLYDHGHLALLAYTLGWIATTLAANGRRLSIERTEQAELLLAQTQRSQEEQLRAARLEEQARIARDIHDVLAHSLAGLTIQLEATAALLEQGADREVILARVRRARALARDGMRETRLAVGALRGEREAATDRIARLVAEARADTPDATIDLERAGELGELEGPHADTVVRVIQESLTNIRKHAPGSDVRVRVEATPAAFVACVEDRAGADVFARQEAGGGSLAQTGGGYGITGMRERATALGGTLDAGPTEGGWRVELRLPRDGAR